MFLTYPVHTDQTMAGNGGSPATGVIVICLFVASLGFGCAEPLFYQPAEIAKGYAESVKADAESLETVAAIRPKYRPQDVYYPVFAMEPSERNGVLYVVRGTLMKPLPVVRQNLPAIAVLPRPR